MLDDTMESRVQVESETTCYADWPAQALAYGLGRQIFIEEGDRAERALGDRFDLRCCHDALLASGRLPLPVLRKRY